MMSTLLRKEKQNATAIDAELHKAIAEALKPFQARIEKLESDNLLLKKSIAAIVSASRASQ